jgi:hypothetical protein
LHDRDAEEERAAVSAARARKKGKITNPKRGRESNGHRELG